MDSSEHAAIAGRGCAAHLERLEGRVHKAHEVDHELEAAKSVDDQEERDEGHAANHVRRLMRGDAKMGLGKMRRRNGAWHARPRSEP